jgi:glutamate-5-semialdehyde dehydrogenase
MPTTTKLDIAAAAKDIGVRAKAAARALAKVDSGAKNRALARIADELVKQTPAIVAANELDLVHGKEKGLSAAMLDRLMLDPKRILGVAAAVKEVIALPDPVGEVTAMWRRPNGIQVGRVRIPLGVVMMVYESRPNVTIDAGVLCLKSGNACILRGGSEAIHSNLALAQVVRAALKAEGLPEDAVQVVPFTDREGILELLKLEDHIDLAIPRGGEGLIRFVAENARVPVIKHYKGVCHAFVDASAELANAVDIVVNAKTQRPGVCNALETLLVHTDVAAQFLPMLDRAMPQVELRGDETVRKHITRAKPATGEDWGMEYLDLILAVRVVDGLDAALDHVARYGSLHSETILTQNYAHAQRWLREVDASCVLVNASTRFNDGGELGLGAEIGISTTKLHAFGPMGLTELTAQKFIVYGEGQIRK